MTESKNSPSTKYKVGQAVKYKLPSGGVADMEITSYDGETGTYILNGEERRVRVPGHLMPLRLVALEEENFKYPVGSKVMVPKNDYEQTKPAGDRKKIAGYIWGRNGEGEYIVLCPSNPVERERILITENILDECNPTESEAKVIDIRAGIHDDLKGSE